MQLKLDTDVRKLAMVKYTLVMIGSSHWFGCIWWLAARSLGFKSETWVEQYLHVRTVPRFPPRLNGFDNLSSSLTSKPVFR